MMKKEAIKVGMVVMHRANGLGRVTRKPDQLGYGWMGDGTPNSAQWLFHADNLRPLTAREKGESQ